MVIAEENCILRHNYACLEDEDNQYKERQSQINEFLQYKLNMIQKELKNVLLGKSYNIVENILNMTFRDYVNQQEIKKETE